RLGKRAGCPYTGRLWGEFVTSRRVYRVTRHPTQGRGAIGSAAVSKTAGCRFESCRPCAMGGFDRLRPAVFDRHRAAHATLRLMTLAATAVATRRRITATWKRARWPSAGAATRTRHTSTG